MIKTLACAYLNSQSINFVPKLKSIPLEVNWCSIKVVHLLAVKTLMTCIFNISSAQRGTFC